MSEYYTKEELRKKILTRFDDGKGPSVFVDGNGITNYRYRTCDGNKCAVGIFIPDELYFICFEGKIIDNFQSMEKSDYANDMLLFQQVLIDSGINPDHFLYLRRWQYRHDDLKNWEGNKYIGPRIHPDV